MDEGLAFTEVESLEIIDREGSVKGLLVWFVLAIVSLGLPTAGLAAEWRPIAILDVDADVGERSAGCTFQVSGESGQGVKGWVLPATPGASFALGTQTTNALTAGGIVNAQVILRPVVAVAFYSEAPTCQQAGTLLSRSEVAERTAASGTVPGGATVAVVTARTHMSCESSCVVGSSGYFYYQETL